MKISIILPCYNVDSFIGDCLRSIYSQDLPEDEFEVICVNDCSVDGTRDVIVGFQKVHNNLQLIEHAENLTTGGARNTGLCHAKGEYVWFVDPDDVICENSLSVVYNTAVFNDADIVFFNYYDADEKLLKPKKNNLLKDGMVMDGYSFIEGLPNGLSDIGIVWRCIYKSEFLRNNNILFPLLRKSQDVIFSWKATIAAHRVKSISDCLYIFRIHSASITHKTKTPAIIYDGYIGYAFEINKILENGNPPDNVSADLDMNCRWSLEQAFLEVSSLPVCAWLIFAQLVKRYPERIRTLSPFMKKSTYFAYSALIPFLLLMSYKKLKQCLR